MLSEFLYYPPTHRFPIASLFRTLNLKVPLTAIAFSPEGAAIYLGTENGKLLITDLRALDKPPKTIAISERGSRIETMSVQVHRIPVTFNSKSQLTMHSQKKIKGGAEPSTKPTTAVSTANPTNTKLSQLDTTTKSVPRSSNNPAILPGKAVPRVAVHVAPSPTRARVSVNNARLGSGPPSAVTSPAARRTTSALNKGGVVASPRARTGTSATDGKTKKTVFSPVRDPLGNSSGVGDGDISGKYQWHTRVSDTYVLTRLAFSTDREPSCYEGWGKERKYNSEGNCYPSD